MGRGYLVTVHCIVGNFAKLIFFSFELAYLRLSYVKKLNEIVGCQLFLFDFKNWRSKSGLEMLEYRFHVFHKIFRSVH